MNKSLAQIIEEKDKIIDEIMAENKYLKKEVERLGHYENLIREIRDEQDKDCWGC